MPRETQAARMAAPAATQGGFASAPPSGGDQKTTVKTRFGVIEFDLNQALTFPKGIPGFVGYQLRPGDDPQRDAVELHAAAGAGAG